jgi:hypothetical protein
VLFEGCAESTTFAGAEIEHGPRGAFAIVGSAQTSVRWGDRELARLEHVAHLRFAPERR